jgi:hypothetical protein
MSLAGVTGRSRTTIGNVLAGGGKKGVSARCDTVADMIWGMGVSVEDLTFRLMMKASSARSAGAPGGENDEFKIRLGEFALCVRLRRLDETRMSKKPGSTAQNERLSDHAPSSAWRRIVQEEDALEPRH